MQRTLIIEDNQDTLDAIATLFLENNVEVITCSTMEIAKNAINNNIPFDFIILDWYFGLEGDCRFSKEILSHLKNKHFKPIFVYAGTIEDYNQTEDAEINYPRNLMSGYSKAITPNELLNEINRIISKNYSLQLAITYRDNIVINLEKVLFELNELQNVDIARILNVIYGDGSNVDWSSDLILNLLHRSLITDNSFTNKLIEILNAASNINDGISVNDRKKIANKILYFHSSSDFIRNGDIVKIIKTDKSILAYGIIVTPDCDLEQSNCCFIDIIELCDIADQKLSLNTENIRKIRNFNHDSFYLFPSLNINDVLSDFVAVLKAKLVLKEVADKYHPNYPKASKRMIYSHEFLLNGELVKAILLCSKTNPYKAEFLQKLQTNNSRVGIPDIKNLIK